MGVRVQPGSPSEARPARADFADPGVEVELVCVPGLGGLYARGAARSAGLAISGALGARRGTGRGTGRRTGCGPGDLPDVAYLARGVRADAARLTAYQHLLGESASDVLPAGFVHVLAFPLATALIVRRDFPLPLVGLVHLANRVEQLRPVSLGDALDVRAYARDLSPHRAGTQVELVTEARVDGELAWRGVSTYLSRSVRLPAAGGVGPAPVRAAPELPAAARVPTGTWRLAADVGRRYASVSGDRNPIHLSPLTARAFGFPRAIAHGMYTASRALATVGAARTEAFTWTVEFAKPVLLPGTVAIRVAAEDDADGSLAYAGWNPRTGKVHLTGSVVPA